MSRKRLKDPWDMNSVMAPHYADMKMPAQNASTTIYTPAAQRQREAARVAKARKSSGFGHR